MASHKHPRTEMALDRARKLLRVSKGSTKKEIEKSFRQLAKTLHPDKVSNREANERFFETCDAYFSAIHVVFEPLIVAHLTATTSTLHST